MIAFLVLLIMGGALGLILAFASDYFYVKEDPRLETVTKMLPGFNCGACGCPGCSGMAEKLLSNEINLTACKPGKEEDFLKIQDYLKNTKGPEGQVVNVKL